MHVLFRALGGAAAERARLLEEFWMRKREAAANKQRGQANYGGYVRNETPLTSQARH